MERLNKSLLVFAIVAALVAAGGLFISVKSLNAVKTWEGRYNDMFEKYKDLRYNHTEKNISINISQDGNSNATLADKNRNLLNIKTPLNGEYWKGQIGEDKFNHAIFESPVWSLRAGILVLRSYEYKHKVDTIEKLVARFCTGNRDAYIKFLEKATKIKRNKKISLMANLHLLIPAMVEFETGAPLGLGYKELLKEARGV